MLPAIDQVLFSLPEGSHSEVLETERGYHIFKVGGKRPPFEKSLEEAKGEIEDKLFRMKAHQRFQGWMEDLKRRAYISIR